MTVGALRIAVRPVRAPPRARASASDLNFGFFKFASVVGLTAVAIVIQRGLDGRFDLPRRAQSGLEARSQAAAETRADRGEGTAGF